MTKKQDHLATKAQANAVREYLATLGVELSHVQALEVLARGQGLRSRHVLAQTKQSQPALGPVATQSSDEAPPQRAHFTRVSYGYIDATNCKRFSSTVFRGRFTVEQLRFIASRLDEGEYFIPAQIGLECLQLAFNEEGDDHYWHKLELGDESEWTLDAEGFVLQAGAVQQLFDANAMDYATDADIDNLFWRFARLTSWDYGLQEQAVSEHVWREPEPFPDGVEDTDIAGVVKGWKQHPWLARLSNDLLDKMASVLLDRGMLPFPTQTQELRRPIGPNAYQYCVLQAPTESDSSVVFRIGVMSQLGTTVAPAQFVALKTTDFTEQVYDAMRTLSDQRRAVRFKPAVYDEAFA